MTDSFIAARRASLSLIGTLLIGTAAQIGAQTLSGPTLGLVVDGQGESLRTVIGIKSNAALGVPLDFGVSLTRKWVAPGGLYAIGEAAGADHLYVLDPRSSANTVIPAIGSGAARIVFSPAGSAMAVFFADKQQVAVVTGLPSKPQVALRSIAALPSSPVSLAVSDDASFLLAGTSSNRHGAVFFIAEGGAPRMITSVGNPSDLTFLKGGEGALIADSDRSEVLLVRDLLSVPTTSVVAEAKDGVASPFAVKSSLDGTRAVALNKDSDSLLLLDLAAGTNRLLHCGFTPSALDRLAGNFVFSLGRRSSSTVQILDGDRQGGKILFVAETGIVRQRLASDRASR